MNSPRSSAILLTIILLTAIWGLVFYGISNGRASPAFIGGILIGSVFGVGTWFYFSEAWDPVNLKTKGGRKQADLRVLWLVPAGIFLARFLPGLIGKEPTSLLAGTALTWASLTLSYMAFQAWRHRQK